jgi:hypothetical protein
MGATHVPEHGAESSKIRALSKKFKGRRLLPNLLSPVSREHPKREENYDDMPQCDTCQHTYHWKCLTDLDACSHTARQATENSENWHCPACTDLTQAEKDTRISFAEEKEMIKLIWQPIGKQQNSS